MDVELQEAMNVLGVVVAIASLASATLASPPLVPMPPAHYEIGDDMSSDEVLSLAAKELASLERYVARYGEQPGVAELRAAANAHFEEGVRRLAAEVKNALDPVSPEEAFRRDVEQLGKDVAAILQNGRVETPEEAFRRDVEALAAEVTAILSSGSRPSPIRQVLPTGIHGDNGERSRPAPAVTTRPAQRTVGKAAGGAGIRRD